jgi:peptidylprolyl isomerase
MRHRMTATLICGLALAVAGCGDDGDEKAAAPSPPPTETETPTAEPTPAAGEKPKVTYEKRSKPPRKLVIKDLKEGKGAAIQSGDTAVVNYVGVDYESGEEFDNSYDRGEPFPVPVGQGQVIPGWDEGLVGMKVGGRRRLIIPPRLAYGAQGSPPAIGPNATLVFVIDLVEKQ